MGTRLSPEEEWARQIVSAALGLPVRFHDDNSADRMPDLMIELPGGDAPLEVTADVDPAYASLLDVFRRTEHRLPIQGLRHTYLVKLAAGCKLKTTGKPLEVFLRSIDEDDSHLVGAPVLVPPELGDRGVLYVSKAAKVAPGVVHLIGPDISGWVEEEALPRWVGEFLGHADRSDVLAKLLAYRDAEQRHVFVVCSTTTEMGVQEVLRNVWAPELPTVDPSLPEPVTHVWVAGTLGAAGCAAWSADRGWWWAFEPRG